MAKSGKQEKAEKPVLNPNYYNVAFLIMDGVYNTEFTAPYDIFQHTIYRKNIKAMNTFTVAKSIAKGLVIDWDLEKLDYTKEEL